MENRAKIDNIVIDNKKKDADFTDWCKVTFQVGHNPNAKLSTSFYSPTNGVFHLQEYFDNTSEKIYERMESFEKLMNVSISGCGVAKLNGFEFNPNPVLQTEREKFEQLVEDAQKAAEKSHASLEDLKVCLRSLK